MNENSLKNLVPYTKETAKIGGSLGGKRSQQLKKEKRKLEELMNWFLDVKTNPGYYKEQQLDFISKQMTNGEAMVMSMIVKAIKGDVQAAIYVRDTAGQKPTEKSEVKTYNAEAIIKMISDKDEY